MTKKISSLLSVVAVALFTSNGFAGNTLSGDMLGLQKQLFAHSYQVFLADVRKSQVSYDFGTDALPTPTFDPSSDRNDWPGVFADWTFKQKQAQSDVLAKAGKPALHLPDYQVFKTAALTMFTSYYQNQPYARVAYLKDLSSTAPGGPEALAIRSNIRLNMPTTYPTDHTLDLKSYVAQRFPVEVQDFVHKHKVALVLDDSSCEDAYSYQKSLGFTHAARFMGDSDNSESQFVFVYNRKADYRLVVCDIRGEDDKTRIVDILGPVFKSLPAHMVHHTHPEPIFILTDLGKKLRVDGDIDLVIIGFQNTVWWQISHPGNQAQADPNWQRTMLTTGGIELDLFYNQTTSQQILSVENMYGDEMLQVMDILYGKGARRFVYMGTAGGLDPVLNIGDVLLPSTFWKPDGTWFDFANDATHLNLTVPSTSKIVGKGHHGWVPTLIEETKSHMNDLKNQGVQAIDVESRYFAEYLNHHPAKEKTVVITISETPLGTITFDQENTMRQYPMNSINQMLPFLITANAKIDRAVASKRTVPDLGK